MSFLDSSLLMPLRRRLSPALQRWHRLSHYWRHFIVAVVLGMGIEFAIHAAHHLAMVKRVQNAVLDTTLQVFSMRDKLDTPASRAPVLLLEDDLAHQSPAWGANQAMSLEQALKLVGHAFDRGATHVFLDVRFDELPQLAEREAEVLAAFTRRYAQPGPQGVRHLYVARSPVVDPCFPQQDTLERLRPAIWDRAPAWAPKERPGLLIHPVLPHYRTDTDHVVRGWDLFGVLRTAPAPAPAAWRFLPSPQLAYVTVRKTPASAWATLPWLQPPSAAEPDRASFAHQQAQAVPLLTEDGFSHELCAHHPTVLGCTPAHAAHAPEVQPHDPVESLAQVNEWLRPLPSEQSCRIRATDLLAQGALSPTGHGAPHDLLYNRIVFDLPSWQRAQNLEQRGYFVRTPLTLDAADDLDWRDRLVAIGAAHAASGDWHVTPVGHMPGVLVNLNAMLSLERLGPVASPSPAVSFLVNALIIVCVAAIFSAISPLAAAAVSALILVGSLIVFHQYLLSHGIWIEFGAPLLGINLHRIIDGYLAHRRLQALADRLPAPEH